MTNIILLEEIERQVTIALGSLSLVEGVDENDNMSIQTTKAQLSGIIQGLRILINHLPRESMTLRELEERQFARAKALTTEEFVNDIIDQHFLESQESDATWGN